ncbi:Heterokaryon incompatibility protein 6, OR allele [Pseudocercospora fuligena]|uniref:Heterokaryon incompatibility protein 6, OR allele n=1 Tax=Pseudocercospora fuligena TaxID=685502 RepID=A0A8H6R6U3_9PEZI|nr:Heterokaryon incompatibility protein 6, OR allele [Pseudocercospora fuligena]
MSHEVWSEQTWPGELYGKLSLSSKRCSIRLLKLLPGQNDDPIACKLVRSTLVGSPPYDALSYTWGDASERRPIQVNDVEVLVTTNLELALRALRRPNCSRVLWVDALCINQHDITERSSQVREMGHIYGCAERVIIWLGQPVKDHELVVRASLQRSTSRERYTDVPEWEQDTTLLRRDLTRALRKIFARPWWTRVWVVQEIARARKDPLVVLSQSQNISFSALGEVATEYIDEVPASFQTLVNIRQRTRVPPRLRNPESEESLASLGRKRLSEDFYFLLNATREFRANDPRDNIFALWTLTRGTGGHHFKPDYNMSMQEVYTAVTAEIIEGLGELDILGLRWGKPRRQLPSWVPDFSTAPVPMPEFVVPSALSSLRPSEHKKSALPRVELFEATPLIKVQAAILDDITEVYSTDRFMTLAEAIRQNSRDAEERQARIDDDAKELYKLESQRETSSNDDVLQGRKTALQRKRQQHLQATSRAQSDVHEAIERQRPFTLAIEQLATLCSAAVVRGTENDFLRVRDGGRQASKLPREVLESQWRQIDEYERSVMEQYQYGVDQARRRRVTEEKDKAREVLTADSEAKGPNLRRLIRGLKILGTDMEDLATECIPYGKRMEYLDFRREQQIRNVRHSLQWSNTTATGQRGKAITEELLEMDESVWNDLDKVIQEYVAQVLRINEENDLPEGARLLLFRTSQGCTGFGSEDLEVGDRLALIHGLSTIVVLRKDDEHKGEYDRFTFRGRALLQMPENGSDVLGWVEDQQMKAIEIV